jgi:type I restriction enzyme S subunit
LCVSVDAKSAFIDAGFAYAAKRRAESGGTTRLLRDLADRISVTVSPHADQHADTMFQYIDLAEVDEVLGAIMSYRQISGRLVGSSKVRFKHKDILFAKIRPSIDNKKVAYVYQELENAVASTEFIVLRPKDDTNPFYLYAALRSNEFTEAVIRECSGDTGRQRIGTQRLLDIPVPWPDEDVRQDIATNVAAYFASLETTMALRQQAIEISGEALGSTTMRTAQPRRKLTKKV